MRKFWFGNSCDCPLPLFHQNQKSSIETNYMNLSPAIQNIFGHFGKIVLPAVFAALSVQSSSSACETMAGKEADGDLRFEETHVQEVGLMAYPNPFSEVTSVSYLLSEGTEVTLEVYDMIGRKVQVLAHAEWQDAGIPYQYLIGTKEETEPRGVYFVRMQLGSGETRVLKVTHR